MSRTAFDDKGNFSVNEILQFSKALLTTFTYYFEWKDQRQEIDFARQFFRFYLLHHNHYAPETFKM